MSSNDKQVGLEARFGRFVESLPNAEVIDRLELPSDPTRCRKADYLLGGRSVIVELKTLSDDVSHKVEAMADRPREQDATSCRTSQRECQAICPKLMEEFTHFQEEASFRTLDLRDVLMHGGT